MAFDHRGQQGLQWQLEIAYDWRASTFSLVPEPGSATLLGPGLLVLATRRRC